MNSCFVTAKGEKLTSLMNYGSHWTKTIPHAKKKSHNGKNNEKYDNMVTSKNTLKIMVNAVYVSSVEVKISSHTNKCKNMNTKRCKEISQERLEKRNDG